MTLKELEDDVNVEIQRILEKLAEEENVDVPKWEWTKTLLTFSRYALEEDRIFIDQIYSHIWAEKLQRRTIYVLLFYEIAFCFYYYVHLISSNLKREMFTPPRGTKARRYAAKKSGVTVKEYTTLTNDLYRNIGSRMIDHLVKS